MHRTTTIDDPQEQATTPSHLNGSPHPGAGQRSTFSMSGQVRLAGQVPFRTLGYTAAGSPTGRACITIRLGGVVLVLEDREALLSLIAAVHRAHFLADRALAPAKGNVPEAQALAALWADEHRDLLSELNDIERKRRDWIVDHLAATRAELVCLEDHLRHL